MRMLLMAGALALMAGPALAADPVEGEWLIQSGNARVKIAPCPGKAAQMCGVVSWLKNPAARDTANPDPALQSRSLMGQTMLRDFKAAGAGRWTGGKIYDPASGKTYDSKMSVNRDGTLKVEGCVAVICQAQTWKRA